MLATARVFSTGNSQAVRLPKAFRVNVSEMWVAKNEITGEITLKPKLAPDALEAFIEELSRMPITDEFLQRRDSPEHPNPFEDWAE